MSDSVHYDDQNLPHVSTEKYRTWLLWLVVVVILVIIALLSKTVLFAEEKFVVCPSPYIDEQTCAQDCADNCNAALFANSKAVCFECTTKSTCPTGLPVNIESCEATCADGVCTSFNRLENCFVCAQCPRGTVHSFSACNETCDESCTLDESSGVPCYTCPQ
jgi:hypothetical protein